MGWITPIPWCKWSFLPPRLGVLLVVLALHSLRYILQAESRISARLCKVVEV